MPQGKAGQGNLLKAEEEHRGKGSRHELDVPLLI